MIIELIFYSSTPTGYIYPDDRWLRAMISNTETGMSKRITDTITIC